MYAVVEIAGKQYKVTDNDKILVPTRKEKPGDKITFERVLLLGSDKEITVGHPMVAGVTERSGGVLDGLVVGAGVQGAAPSLVVSVNYFGAVATLEGLRPLLAKGTDPSAVAISSNSTTATLGSVVTYAVHPPTATHRQLSAEQLAAAGIAPGLVRISVGLEDVEDLLTDVDQALSMATGFGVGA